MKPDRVINLATLPQGQTYEDRYQGYLKVFHDIATTPGNVHIHVESPPWSWVPLLRHLRCSNDVPVNRFEHCPMVAGAMLNNKMRQDRTALEVLCNFRPETADALWKCDMQWPTSSGRVVDYGPSREFIVTTNGAFHRPEVLEFMERLRHYTPTKRKVIIVPCAADKPYPAPMHEKVLSMIPDDYYVMNATGVLGLIPQDLWGIMPWYDSGIPNEWRLFNIARNYFKKHQHDRVIVFADFYAQSLHHAFASLGMLDEPGKVRFVLPVQFYADYVDLLTPERLQALAAAISEFEPTKA
jgi:hypothetical protein